MDNLDTLAAHTAQAIIAATLDDYAGKEVDNLATKALGVLQENGVYAGMLFLYSRTGKDEDIAPVIRGRLLALVSTLVPGVAVPPDDAQSALQCIADHIANDLDTLLLVKQVWEQTLVYVRYGAKARG